MSAEIVVLVKGYPRLSETFIAQEILGLERAGVRLTIFSMRRPSDAAVHPVHRQISADVRYLCEYVHHEPLRVLRSLWRLRAQPGLAKASAAFWQDLRRDFSRNRVRRFGQALVLAAEFPPQAQRILAHFIHTPASVARYASLLLERPWSCSAHAKDIWTTPDWDLAAKLGAAEWVVTCTKSGRDRLDALASPGKPVELIYHGLDFDRFMPMTAPRSGRDGSDGSLPAILLTVGRAVEKKGLDVLIEALAKLPRDLHWRWIHVGHGPLRRALARRAETLGLADRIEWRGALAQEAVLAEYRAADLFVLPCRVARDGDRDGLPNVLVEALSQGLACLSTQVAGVPELIEDERTGLLVAAEDAHSLSRALQRLIGDPALRHRLGKAGACHVRQSFDHRAGIRRLVELLGGSRADARGRTVAAPVES